MSKHANTLPQANSARLLSVSELDAVTGGLKEAPPVCKPTYPKLGSATNPTA
jgi:hypothetical protein